MSFSDASPTDLSQQLFNSDVRHIYIDGGQVIQSFLRDGLVDELTISRIPVLIGSGIPLFGELEYDILLEPLHSEHYEFGIVQTKYRVTR